MPKYSLINAIKLQTVCVNIRVFKVTAKHLAISQFTQLLLAGRVEILSVLGAPTSQFLITQLRVAYYLMSYRNI